MRRWLCVLCAVVWWSAGIGAKTPHQTATVTAGAAVPTHQVVVSVSDADIRALASTPIVLVQADAGHLVFFRFVAIVSTVNTPYVVAGAPTSGVVVHDIENATDVSTYGDTQLANGVLFDHGGFITLEPYSDVWAGYMQHSLAGDPTLSNTLVVTGFNGNTAITGGSSSNGWTITVAYLNLNVSNGQFE